MENAELEMTVSDEGSFDITPAMELPEPTLEAQKQDGSRFRVRSTSASGYDIWVN